MWLAADCDRDRPLRWHDTGVGAPHRLSPPLPLPPGCLPGVLWEVCTRAQTGACWRPGLGPSLASLLLCLLLSVFVCSAVSLSSISVTSPSFQRVHKSSGAFWGRGRYREVFGSLEDRTVMVFALRECDGADAYPRDELGSVVCTQAYPSSPAICHHCTRSGEDGVEGYVDRLGNECE